MLVSGFISCLSTNPKKLFLDLKKFYRDIKRFSFLSKEIFAVDHSDIVSSRATLLEHSCWPKSTVIGQILKCSQSQTRHLNKQGIELLLRVFEEWPAS